MAIEPMRPLRRWSRATDQFSIRIDHKISDKASLMTRFSLNQVTGPLTNPDQTAINPGFGVQFFDHQRNAGVHYTRAISPHLTSETSLGYIRSTPFFPHIITPSPGSRLPTACFSLTIARRIDFRIVQQSLSTQAGHGLGARNALRSSGESEIRANRDSTIFGMNPNGLYEFGGGTAYSPVNIPSASGTHNIQAGDPLPDSLTGLLTATPYSYNIVAAAGITPIGDKFNEAGGAPRGLQLLF